MNIFYAPPEQIHEKIIELRDQEARHASKVLRYAKGDEIVVVDGKGGWHEGKVRQIGRESMQVEVIESKNMSRSRPRLKLALSIIKKRDRLEFAVEKAVELGVAEIILFKSAHTIKQNIRMDRLEATAISAMKQSLRTWLPPVTLVSSLAELLAISSGKVLVAHEKVDDESFNPAPFLSEQELLLLVGPEGGFSNKEIVRIEESGGEKVSLGNHRLRAETAAVVFLSQFM